jgi:hypothetical protein
MPSSNLPPLDHLDPVKAWEPWEPTQDEPWDLKWAAHLYRRAAFGGSPAEHKAALKAGHKKTIDLLMNGELSAKNFLDFIKSGGRDVAKVKQPNPQEQMFAPREPSELREWWLGVMLMYGHPLREKMTLFWHNHFATSIAKVQSWRLMVEQNIFLRENALAKFGPFLLEMSKDPAMLIWLDSNDNIKGHANENYGREIQELFALGLGNYTEKDVQEAARAFTGWHTDGEKFDFKANLHDDGEKTYLGVKGNLNGDDVVNIILKQPACARFLVTKLYRYFISELEVPPQKLIEPLAEQFRKSDYDIAAVVRTIISSNHFYSAYAFRRRIKSPVEFVLGAVKSTAETYEVSKYPLVKPIDTMGQPLFAPPNVKGWRYGEAWLSTATVLARQNFGQALAIQHLLEPKKRPEFNPNLGMFEGDTPDGFPDPRKPAQISAKEEEPEPTPTYDPARHIGDLMSAAPEKVVERLLDVYLPGGLSAKKKETLTAFVAKDNPADKALKRRVREAVHAIISLPEYQMA